MGRKFYKSYKKKGVNDVEFEERVLALFTAYAEGKVMEHISVSNPLKVKIEVKEHIPMIMFPPTFNSYQRMTVHKLADALELNHISIGEGSDRHIIVSGCELEDMEDGKSSFRETGQYPAADIAKPQQYFKRYNRDVTSLKKFQFTVEQLNTMETFMEEPLILLDPTSSTPVKKPDNDVVILPAVWVNTLEGLTFVVGEIEKVSYFAVDLEIHNTRSYYGFTALMQLNVNGIDYLVDTIALWDEIPALMTQVFGDPKKMKIFHGAQGSDIQCLQRDFNICLVNVFDTFYGAKALGIRNKSLAGLIHEMCGVDLKDAKNKYCRSDWRIRPLSAEQQEYARNDTRFLPYICDQMCRKLLDPTHCSDRMIPSGETTLIEEVLAEGQEQCMRRWEPKRAKISLHAYKKDKMFKAMQKNKKNWTRHRIHRFRYLYYWREQIARQWDESPHYICPSKTLCKIAVFDLNRVEDLLRPCAPLPPLFNPEIKLEDGGLSEPLFELLEKLDSEREVEEVKESDEEGTGGFMIWAMMITVVVTAGVVMYVKSKRK